MDKKLWFITGISSGIGKALAETIMQHDEFVVGTFRKGEQVEAFNEKYEGKGYAVILDITNPDAIVQTVKLVTDRFGKVDVLVNNAGFGFAGAVEETSESEFRDVIETNVFGTWNVTKAFLPVFRRQKSGHIIQISSQSGFKSMPGFGIYNASKFALEGFSEALAAEVAPLGIHLTLVEPGPFRTNFAAESFHQAKERIADYDGTAGAFRERMEKISGQQEGDPNKAAEAIVNLSRMENPPLRLPLGKSAITAITSKLESVQKDVDAFREVAENAVY